MAKKKSKTQKYKRNLKRKQNKTAGTVSKSKSNVIKINKEQKDKLKKAIEEELNILPEEPHSKIVEKDKINYDVMITYENKEKLRKEKKKNESIDDELSKTKELLKSEIKAELREKVKAAVSKMDSPQKIVDSERLDDITTPFLDEINNKKKKTYFELVLSRIKQNIAESRTKKKEKALIKAKKEQDIIELPKLKKTVTKAPKTVKQINKEEYYDPYEIKIEKKVPKSKNPIIKLLFDIYNNAHIIFNSIGIVIYIIMIVGLVRIDVLESSTIIYISCIVGFLLFIAVSFNKWISGKIFTIIISLGMLAAISHMQYTYDFIRNLNTGVYEYKTYYVVTFDNGVNKSIYNINSKKVGLLKDNCTNIERKLDTKIEPVYVEYDDINQLFDDFYSSKFRAILVNENQYKYMKNNIQNDREVKILYEFKANAKK